MSSCSCGQWISIIFSIKVFVFRFSGFATGVYTTNNPEACKFILSDSETNIAVVENDAQLKKMLPFWPDLPHLKAIVQYTGELSEARKNVYTVRIRLQNYKSK